jgi:hypothetical protein
MSIVEKDVMTNSIIFIVIVIYLIRSRETIYKKIGRDKRAIVKCAISVLIISGVLFSLFQSQSIIYKPLKQKNIEELKRMDGIIGFKGTGRGSLILQIKHNGQYLDITMPLGTTTEELLKYANKHAEVWYTKPSKSRITYQLNVDNEILYSLAQTNSSIKDYNTSIYFKNLIIVDAIVMSIFYFFIN